MRRAALVLAVAVVAAVLLFSKRGGPGGRAERNSTAPAEEAAPPGPPASARAGSTASDPPEAQAWQAVGDVNAARGSVEILLWWGDEPDRRIAYGPINDGRFAIELPVLAEMPAFLRRGAGLTAHASAPGFVSGESLRVPLADKEAGEIPLDVKLEPGVAVRGRVGPPQQRPPRCRPPASRAARPAPPSRAWAHEPPRARLPAVPSPRGDTEEEAFRNIREAIELYLEPAGDVGKGAKVVEVVV